MFRKEENTLVEYNNRGYNYIQNTRRRKNKAKINENYIEPENHSASNRFTRRQNNSQLQSQNKNYRRQDGFNQNNRELKSKNKYSANQTRTRQQNVVHQNGTTYIGKNSPNRFLEQRVSAKAGGTRFCYHIPLHIFQARTVYVSRFQQILILIFDIHFSINLALIPKCRG
jgi:Tfp pilus assembly protein PilE